MSASEQPDSLSKAATPFDSLHVYAAQFRAHLESLHLSRLTLVKYDRSIEVLRGEMKAFSIELKDLDEAKAVDLIGRAAQPPYLKTHNVFAMKTFVRFLVGLGAAGPVATLAPDESVRGRLKRDYEEYLRRQRGLSERTIFHSWRMADRFLEFRFGTEIGELSRVTATDIVGFLQHVTQRHPPLRDKTIPSHLRNFFRYLFKVGKTTVNLALGIPCVAQRYGARLPRHLSTEQVETLVQAVRNDPVGGRRNYAMVLLTARLGLRASEIIAVQIDDIDWRSGEILVRGKGERYDRVPLPSDVGEALADYIRLGRVTTTRALFVRDRPPHQSFKNGQTLNFILKRAFAKTGLTPPVPYVGSHILRHSLATNLMQRGASLEEIGDMLRHRSRQSTMIYAKLDIDGLRSIAQPWPVVGGGE
jgi:integrase/recombinase XerD